MEDDISSSESSEEEDDWTEGVVAAQSVEEAMRVLWEQDPQTFYIYGERVMKMVEYRLRFNWVRPPEDVD